MRVWADCWDFGSSINGLLRQWGSGLTRLSPIIIQQNLLPLPPKPLKISSCPLSPPILQMEAIKYSRKNEDCRPFEVGGETRLEFYAHRSDCGLFALASHTKKRPHNLVLGRFYDGRLYDALELGVAGFKAIHEFGSAGTGANLGAKPCILFVGEKFDSVPALKQARSTLLDFFRGEQVTSINLAGLDRVMVAYAVGDTQVLLRQFVIKFKKSGTRTPRVTLQEMGPRWV